MAGRQMRWAMLVEWLFYAVAGAWLHARGGSWPEVGMAAVAAFLGIRFLIVAMSYGFLLAGTLGSWLVYDITRLAYGFPSPAALIALIQFKFGIIRILLPFRSACRAR